MKKLTYLIFPLFVCLQLNSCGSGKIFSRDPLPEEIDENKLIEVTGFKDRISYENGILSSKKSNVYDNQGRLIGSETMEVNVKFSRVDKYITNEYGYDNKNGLLNFEKEDSIEYKENEVKTESRTRTIVYDDHNHITADAISITSSSGDTHTDSITNSYKYNEDKLIGLEEKRFHNEEQDSQKSFAFNYDDKGRLIKEEDKCWDAEDSYDNPDDFSDYRVIDHIYEGNKVTDLIELTLNVGEDNEEKHKEVCVAEFDSNSNITHQISNKHKIGDDHFTLKEEHYEYNARGLETSYTSYETNGPYAALSNVTHRNTVYYNNSNKILSRTSATAKVHKLSDGNSEKFNYKGVTNYYDNSGRVIKQEIIEDKIPPLLYTTYFFEY